MNGKLESLLGFIVKTHVWYRGYFILIQLFLDLNYIDFVARWLEFLLSAWSNKVPTVFTSILWLSIKLI